MKVARIVISGVVLAAVVLAGCASWRGAAAPGGICLARGGRAALPIVVSNGASESTRDAAQQLAVYLQRISGAPFEVIEADGTAGIVVGTLADFPDRRLRGPLELRGSHDGKEAFAIRTEPHRLRLIGATDLAVSHAVFRLLEVVGCRWFFPAPEWEVVPSHATLIVAHNETSRPALWGRRIWYGYGFFDRSQGRVQREYEQWARRNRMQCALKIYCGHAWQSIIARNQAAFDEHPEYLALVGGERKGHQFCVSRPEVRAMAVQWARDHFERMPEADMVSLETSDGAGHCECEDCLKLGCVSDRVFGLANEVARVVAQEYPGKMVGLYAYSDHCEPPSFELEPNVYVQSTAGFIRGRYTFDELIELWPKLCRNMGFYEYFSVWLWDFDRLPGGRANDMAYIRKQIPLYAARNATSIDCESGNNWGPHGRGYYIANKLMWDPGADVDALLEDFYAKAFGPAVASMKQYYERFDRGNDPLMSEHLVALGLRDVEEATRLAAERPDVLVRLDALKQYLHYVHLRWLIDRETDKDKKKALTLEALTHCYRTRYTYMNHWEAMRQGWTGRAAEEFGEPTWSAREPTTPKPWMSDEPYTREETEQAFRRALERFKADPVEEIEFSTDYVPVDLGAAGIATRQKYQGGLRYALYSRQGEALEVGLVAGTIAWYRDRAEARYTVTDAGGGAIAEGRLPLDGEVHAMTVPVPGSGLYFLDFNDSSAGWRIEAEPERACTILLMRDRKFAHAGHMQAMYFYVPRGTKRIEYFWQGGPHDVYGPDGTKVTTVETSGRFVKVDVPAGADGKAWSFRRLALGHLWFFNIPNCLASSPLSLLLPSEVALADGIAVAHGE